MNVKSKLDVLGLGEFKEDLNIYGNVDILSNLNEKWVCYMKENVDILGDLNVKSKLDVLGGWVSLGKIWIYLEIWIYLKFECEWVCYDEGECRYIREYECEE